VPDSCGARVVLGRWAVRTGHDAGMQRVRRMAKRDFPCGWSGTGVWGTGSARPGRPGGRRGPDAEADSGRVAACLRAPVSIPFTHV
jgi:hypothetical protein